MFPKKNRLAKDADIKRVLAAGRSFFAPHIGLKYFHKAISVPRLTFVVSTKVSKQAVKRNRLKRVLRAELSGEVGRLKPGDYLFRLKPGSVAVPESELRRELRTLILRAGLLK